MTGSSMPLGRGEIEVLILRALVRKLVAKGALSPDDVRALLLDAAMGLDLIGGELTPEAAQIMVEEDLAPAFLGRSPTAAAPTRQPR